MRVISSPKMSTTGPALIFSIILSAWCGATFAKRPWTSARHVRRECWRDVRRRYTGERDCEKRYWRGGGDRSTGDLLRNTRHGTGIRRMVITTNHNNNNNGDRGGNESRNSDSPTERAIRPATWSHRRAPIICSGRLSFNQYAAVRAAARLRNRAVAPWPGGAHGYLRPVPRRRLFLI